MFLCRIGAPQKDGVEGGVCKDSPLTKCSSDCLSYLNLDNLYDKVEFNMQSTALYFLRLDFNLL